MSEHLIIKYGPHVDGDPLFVSDSVRMCVACPDGRRHHDLVNFKQKTGTKKYSVLCFKCIKHLQDEENRKKEREAVDILKSTIDTVSKREKTVSSFDVMQATCVGMGGAEVAFELTGKVLSKSMTRGLLEDADHRDRATSVKASKILLDMAASAEKKRAATIDLTDMTMEELMDILLPQMKVMILQSPEFLRHLMGDAEVRLKLTDELKKTLDVSVAPPAELLTSNSESPPWE